MKIKTVLRILREAAESGAPEDATRVATELDLLAVGLRQTFGQAKANNHPLAGLFGDLAEGAEDLGRLIQAMLRHQEDSEDFVATEEHSKVVETLDERTAERDALRDQLQASNTRFEEIAAELKNLVEENKDAIRRAA